MQVNRAQDASSAPAPQECRGNVSSEWDSLGHRSVVGPETGNSFRYRRDRLGKQKPFLGTDE
jgi:hypothetical protein